MEDDDVLVIGGEHRWLDYWRGPVIPFEMMTVERIRHARTVILCPGQARYTADARRAIEWKRDGLLDGIDLILGTYKGRHIWTPEIDHLVSQWVVHARSEREVLDSDRLAFIPLCGEKTIDPETTGSDGYLFTGGRKWREPERAIEAIVRTGLPGRVITDFCPPHIPPQIDVTRERVDPETYFDAMARARVILLPLKGTPVSHGHTDAVNAVLLGRPLVVTAGASCDDYVQDGVTGILVHDNSVEAWIAAARAAFDRADEMAAAARVFAADLQNARYAEYLRQIVRHPGSRQVGRAYSRPQGNPDRTEWLRANQAAADRQRVIDHGARLRDANDALRDGRYAAAIEIADACLDGPKRVQALQIIAKSRYRLDPASAIPWLEQVVAEGGPTPDTLADLAESLRSAGRWTEALAAAENALAANPARIVSFRILAQIQAQTGAAAAARATIARGMTVNPDDAGLKRIARQIP